MADPQSYRPASGDIPTHPGVYRFRDPHGRVIYVGKAKKPAQPTEQLLCSPGTPEPENLRYGAYCRQRGVDGSRQRT